MGDLIVHDRMKDCCRTTLGGLDTAKKDVPGSGVYGVGLLKLLGDKTIPDARTALSTSIGQGEPKGEPKFVGVKKKICIRLAHDHAKEHQGKGESREAAFWNGVAGMFDGKAPLAPVRKVSGDEIASKAQDKIAEYKKNGITYSQSGAKGTADCSHFVHDVLTSSGMDAPHVTAKDGELGIRTSPAFEEVTDPQPGDVVWQPGPPAHMGVYTGKDADGHVLGAEMGNHGAAVGKWGPGGWFKGGDEMTFYRPKQ
jgi:hypothetical protein